MVSVEMPFIMTDGFSPSAGILVDGFTSICVDGLHHLPPLRREPDRRLTSRVWLETRESEAHEPLAGQRRRHLLQDRDAPGVDLDQVVVGGEDRGDLALDIERWNFGCERSEISELRCVCVAPLAR